MPRLLLINPRYGHEGLGNVRSTAWPPLSLPYIAAVTPAHYDVEILDENVAPFRLRAADIVGITAYTATVRRAYEIAAAYRERHVPTVIGGIHASMLPDEALRFCDTVVVGEAEEVWPQVLRDFENGQLRRIYSGGLVDLAKLPIPRRDLLTQERYRWGSIQTSRGCPMDCSFCSVSVFNGRRFRRRPLNAVLEELASLPQRRVLIADDNICGYSKEDVAWAREFFERIRERRLRKVFFAQAPISFGEHPDLVRTAYRAGLRIVLVGIESVNAESLSAFNKRVNLRAAEQDRVRELIRNIRTGGVAVLGAFILGTDDDDKDVFHGTLEFVRSAHIDALQLTKPTPLPGTRLWSEMEQSGRMLTRDYPREWDEFRFTKLVFAPRKMTVDQVYRGFTYLRREYYRTRETIRRTLSTLVATKSIAATVLAYLFDRSYRRAFRRSGHYAKYRGESPAREFRTSAPRSKPAGPLGRFLRTRSSRS